ncbi:MAG: hypothetical protein D6816_07025 [Bacteroidetes bacterium]|nr:MAG: hypothetical protein D6816_07025 [Bacteroidota bacterium]
MALQGSFAFGGRESIEGRFAAFLQQKRFAKAAMLAKELNEACVTGGNDGAAWLWASIEQLCLACEEQHVQIERFYGMYETAVRCEQTLHHRLDALVKLLPVEDEPVGQEEEPVAAAEPSPQLMVYTFGAFRVYENGRLLDNWVSQKAKAIFKYMLHHRERPLHREELMAQFWPDEDAEAARRNLYQAVYMLRQTLQAHSDVEYILNGDGRYRLNPDITIWVDHAAFKHHIEQGQKLAAQNNIPAAIQQFQAADTLYEGDYLNEDVYEEWTFTPRETFKMMHLEMLNQLSQHYWNQHNDAMCITICRKILQQDNCREDTHRRLMQVYMRQGQRHLALRQYQQCAAALNEELGVGPMSATMALYQQIVAHSQNGRFQNLEA